MPRVVFAIAKVARVDAYIHIHVLPGVRLFISLSRAVICKKDRPRATTRCFRFLYAARTRGRS